MCFQLHLYRGFEWETAWTLTIFLPLLWLNLSDLSQFFVRPPTGICCGACVRLNVHRTGEWGESVYIYTCVCVQTLAELTAYAARLAFALLTAWTFTAEIVGTILSRAGPPTSTSLCNELQNTWYAMVSTCTLNSGCFDFAFDKRTNYITSTITGIWQTCLSNANFSCSSLHTKISL